MGLDCSGMIHRKLFLITNLNLIFGFHLIGISLVGPVCGTSPPPPPYTQGLANHELPREGRDSMSIQKKIHRGTKNLLKITCRKYIRGALNRNRADLGGSADIYFSPLCAVYGGCGSAGNRKRHGTGAGMGCAVSRGGETALHFVGDGTVLIQAPGPVESPVHPKHGP